MEGTDDKAVATASELIKHYVERGNYDAATRIIGEIKAQRYPAKPTSFVDCSQEAIASFLKSETKLSRPTPLALAYLLRQRYGERAFIEFCHNKL